MWKAMIVDRDYGSVSPDAVDHLQRQYREKGIDLRAAHYKTPADIIGRCGEADVLLGTGNPPLTKEVFEALPKLRAVQRFGIGVNSVDLKAASENGVLVLYMPGFCVEELAHHAAALILGLLRNVNYYDRSIRNGEWRKAGGYAPFNPRDMVLGLYGFGGSAKPLCSIFKSGFGTKVITYDPYIDKADVEKRGAEAVSFQELLERSDIISLHAPLTQETQHVFNREVFRKMKREAMIINISRGGLIHESDLIEALDQGEIRFAGLDVFEEEPLPQTSKLIAMENVILTCHSAFYGVGAQKNQLGLAVELVDGLLNHNRVPARNIANPESVSKASVAIMTI